MLDTSLTRFHTVLSFLNTGCRNCIGFYLMTFESDLFVQLPGSLHGELVTIGPVERDTYIPSM